MTFDEAQQLFRDDHISSLASTSVGLRYLKLKSLSRREHLERLFHECEIEPESTGVRNLFKESFDTKTLSSSKIDQTIDLIYAEERAERKKSEDELVSHLYRLNSFDWGGLHQNSLEKTIVDNYIKKIDDFDVLSSKVDNELHNSLRGYVMCSWYNHWTSIVIEDVFKDHNNVLPAVGLIKRIDFFINNVPFDLKVTYLPEGYIKDARRIDGKRPELTLLKQSARRLNIHFDGNLNASVLLTDLWYKHRDHPSDESRDLISELTAFRKKIIGQIRSDPTDLIRWLYENQGVRRFDASNRLFLILIDENNFFDSWKLKRAKPLLVDQIHAYLNSVGTKVGVDVSFQWEGSTYTATSDAVLVIHKSN